MTSLPADSPKTTKSVVILGHTPTAAALRALCARHDIRASLSEFSADDAASGGSSLDFKDCTVLVDTRTDEAAVSARDLRAAEALLPASAVVVGMTSHRSLNRLGQSLAHPERFAGLVQPVDLDHCEVVEIVRTSSTSKEATAELVGLMQRLGKAVIVVRDAPGLFSPRVSTSFLNEAMSLVGEGVAAAAVERAALEAGMPSGPLAVLDRVSLKLSDELLHQELHDLEHEARAGDQQDGDGVERTQKIASGGGNESAHDQVHGHRHDDHRHAEHDHKHGDAHGQAHDHGHAHDHDHSQESAHDHSQEHAHEHDHAHEHEHEHEHEDGHAHEHDHEHGHGDDRAHDHREPDVSSTANEASSKTRPSHKHAHKVQSKRMPEPAVYVMEKMAHGYRRMGQAAGAGFYEYADDGTTSLWSGLKAFERRNVQAAGADVTDRLLYIQVLEAVRCLEEGIVESTADVDRASIDLCGFPPATGGAVQYINRLGTAKFVARARELATRYGDRFQPPARLAGLADRDEPLVDSDSRHDQTAGRGPRG